MSDLKREVVKVSIGIPNMGATHPEAYQNHMLWMSHLGSLELASQLGLTKVGSQVFDYKPEHIYSFSFFTAGRLYTAKAREVICETALSVGADYIVMLDDDMIVPMDWLEQLLKHEVDLVAPLAFCRKPPFLPVIYQKSEGVDPVTNVPFAYNRFVRNYPRNQLTECDAIGFGGVVIKASVVKKLSKPYFCLTSPNGEDVNFCYRLKEEAGARIFMDTAVKIGHIGDPQVITEELVDGWLKDQGQDDPSKESMQYVPQYPMAEFTADMKS